MIVDPGVIEKKSFEIITSELKSEIKQEFRPTILRMIHTTADFDYADITEIHPDAIRNGIRSIRMGKKIYADTNMVFSGINKKVLMNYNCEVYTLVADDEVKKEAEARGVTRSIVAVETAVKHGDTGIFVIGNAPTALFTLKRLIDEGAVKPDLVIGVPVGFVGAAESKEEIKHAGVPYIVTNGRKGGSNVAAAIVNSIIYQIEDYD